MKAVMFTGSARRAYRKLPPKVRSQIDLRLQRYVETGHGDVRAMVGEPGARLRVGDYRVIFEETEATIVIHAVGHRREVYR